jgi:hypothetical protein
MGHKGYPECELPKTMQCGTAPKDTVTAEATKDITDGSITGKQANKNKQETCINFTLALNRKMMRNLSRIRLGAQLPTGF